MNVHIYVCTFVLAYIYVKYMWCVVIRCVVPTICGSSFLTKQTILTTRTKEHSQQSNTKIHLYINKYIVKKLRMFKL